MPAGRPTKPVALHLVEGTFRKDRHGDASQPPDAEDLSAPAHLGEIARQEWERRAPILSKLGLLTQIDTTALEFYCLNYGIAREAEAVLAKKGRTMRTPQGMRARPEVQIAAQAQTMCATIWREFGMTPASRTKVPTTAPKKESALETLRAAKAARAAKKKAG